MMAAHEVEGLNLGELLAGFADVGAAAATPVSGISLDSRQLRPGSVFAALIGHVDRGSDFIADALERGACAVLVDAAEPAPALPVPVVQVAALRQNVSAIAGRFYGDPSLRMRVIGVTGTNGKTTASHLLAGAWQQLQRRPCAYLGTLGGGLLDHLEETGLTTPDAVTLQRILADARAAGACGAVLEASSHALDQHRLDGVALDCAVFTNLSHDHLDYHGDMASYGAAKRRLFEQPGLSRAVLNADDLFTREIMKVLPGETRIWTYGSGEANGAQSDCHVSVRILDQDAGGMRLELRARDEADVCRLPLIGSFNADNAAAVVATLCAFDVPLGQATQMLARARQIPGRMQRLPFGAPATFIDYAHTPDALEKALRTLQSIAPGRVWCVFGCGGDRDRDKRPLMGAISAHYADHVIVTSDNPRSESVDAIIDDVIAGAPRPDTLLREPDRARAIEMALAQAGADDVVLIAGKGHEEVQVVGNARIPFSDADVVQRLYRERCQ